MEPWFDKLLLTLMVGGFFAWVIALAWAAIDNNKHRYDR